MGYVKSLCPLLNRNSSVSIAKLELDYFELNMDFCEISSRLDLEQKPWEHEECDVVYVSYALVDERNDLLALCISYT